MFKNITTNNEIKRELSGKIILFAEVFNKSDKIKILKNSKEIDLENIITSDNKILKSLKKDSSCRILKSPKKDLSNSRINTIEDDNS